MADASVLTEMEQIARERRASLGSVIREAMARYVAEEIEKRPSRELPAFVGMFEGPGDVADHFDEILREEWPKTLTEEIRSGTEDWLRRKRSKRR